jgi:Ca2+-binding RTX toxin-like protein
MSFGFKFRFGSHGDDTINGLSGNEIIFAFAGNDKIYANDGNDIVAAGAGNDMAYGGSGNDRLYGESGDDMVWGDSGDDSIFGGVGNDTLEGGTGDDFLKGGDGVDRFVFNPNRAGEGHDVIADFTLGTDKIVLSVTNVLASTPGLLALSGDPTAFETTDLDASDLWGLSASYDGDLLVTHPNGTIELNGVKFADSLNFGAILPALELVA